MAKYRYYINFVKAIPVWTEFFPNEDAKATKKRPDGKEFYRENINELKIKRAGPGRDSGQDNITVYDTLETWFFDETKFNDEIEIEIYRGTRAGTLYYAGFFSISDSTLNREYKTFGIVPIIDDEYRGFVDAGEAEFDIRLDIALDNEDMIYGTLFTFGAWTIKTPAGADFDFDTFNGTSNITSLIDLNAGQLEARHQSIGAVTNNLTVVLRVLSFTLNSGTAPFVDIWNGADTSITDEGDTVIAAGDIEFTINSTTTGYIVIHTTPNTQVTNCSMLLSMYTECDIKNGSSGFYMTFLEEFITDSERMDLAAFAGKVKSTYINNDALPSDKPSSINTWMTSYPDGNYASGNTVANPLNEFLLSATYRWVTAINTGINVSFNQLMSELMNTIQGGWYIDADGNFRIEHIKYFEKLWEDSTALDITGATYTKYKPEKDAREFTFSKALLANREQSRWQQVGNAANSEDFIGVDIIYDNLETISNVLSHEARITTTDIQWMLDNPGDGSADGLTYIHGTLLDSGKYLITYELGILSAGQVQNGHFSWANLHDKYWTWRRMSENGDMNDGDTVTFDSAVKFLEQSGIKFGYTSTLGGFVKITTTDGTAQQIETVRDLATDFVTMLLAYNPY